MKFRKLAALCLAALCLLSLAACGATASQGASSDGVWRMAYVVSVRDEYLSKLEEAVIEAAANHDVAMEILHAGEDSVKVRDCIEAAKSHGNDAVIVNMVASEDAASCIEAAGDMKVVFINRVPVDYALFNENVAAVASDERLSGAYQGDFLGGYFNAVGQKDVRYILLHGTGGLVHTELRTQGVLQGMEAAGLNLTSVAVLEAGYDRYAARNAMAELLAEESPEFDCVISNNDAMALGAIMAMKDAGIDPNSVPVVGIDATADALQAIADGEMIMSVHQSAEMQGDGAVMAALNMLTGKSLIDGTDYEISDESDYLVYVPFEPVTKANLADFTA